MDFMLWAIKTPYVVRLLTVTSLNVRTAFLQTLVFSSGRIYYETVNTFKYIAEL